MRTCLQEAHLAIDSVYQLIGSFAENMTAMDDENPYAPPKYAELDRDLLGETPNAAWRDKDAGEGSQGSGASPIDVSSATDRPMAGRSNDRLSWASPYWALSILLVGPLLFAIVYVVVSRRGKVTVGPLPAPPQETVAGHRARLASGARGHRLHHRDFGSFSSRRRNRVRSNRVSFNRDRSGNLLTDRR